MWHAGASDSGVVQPGADAGAVTVRDLFPVVEQPEPGWSRRKRIGVVAVTLLVGMLIGPHMPILRRPAAEQSERRAEPVPSKLPFPTMGQTTAGVTVYFTPCEAMAPTQADVAAWPVYRAERWVGLGCHNDHRQSVGPGRDVVVTVWRGSSPTTMQPTTLRCPIIGSDEPFQTCYVGGDVAFAATDWAKVETHVGEQVSEPTEGFSCTAFVVPLA